MTASFLAPFALVDASLADYFLSGDTPVDVPIVLQGKTIGTLTIAPDESRYVQHYLVLEKPG